MNRNELMLVTAALLITGMLKLAEMPVRALGFFGHNPAVMAMEMPPMPVFADAPSAPEAPKVATAAEAVEAPVVEAVEAPPVSIEAAVHAKVQKDLAKAACKRVRLQRMNGPDERAIEMQVNETVRRAVAQSAQAWKNLPGTE